MTALNPTTGTKAANNVPKTTCIGKVMISTGTKNVIYKVESINIMVLPWLVVDGEVQWIFITHESDPSVSKTGSKKFKRKWSMCWTFTNSWYIQKKRQSTFFLWQQNLDNCTWNVFTRIHLFYHPKFHQEIEKNILLCHLISSSKLNLLLDEFY